MKKYLILTLLLYCYKQPTIFDNSLRCKYLDSKPTDNCKENCGTYQHERVKDYHGDVYYAPVVDMKGRLVGC